MRLARKVLLVGWDAADWGIIHPLLDRGELPALQSVIDGGVSGNLASIRPMLSPMLWTSIATGKRPHKHGVHGFTEVAADTRQVRPVSSGSRRAKALWDILGQSGLRSQVVSWFATHPAETLAGVCVSDLFAISPSSKLPRRTVSPAGLEPTLGELRVRLEDLDANVLKLFVPDLGELNLSIDSRPAVLAKYLAECFTTHAAATWLLEHEPADLTAVYYRAIDWISHDFMPYHPPRMEGVAEKDCALYGEVVNGIYRLHDRMLGRLLQLAGEETTVVLVSDHGFHHNHLRPRETARVAAGIAAWHRPLGIMAMRGAPLRRDELVHGANLLDIAPTILTLFGLPIGRDMDGRVLGEAFEEAPRLAFVPTWETIAGQNGPARTRAPLDPEGAQALQRHFAELGYVTLRDDPVAAEMECKRENDWNLGRAYLDAGLAGEALPLLEEIYYAWPERTDYGLQLANCQLQLGLDEEAAETMETVLEPAGQSALSSLIRGNIEYRRRSFERSLELLREAEAADPRLPGIYNQIGLSLLKLSRWEDAAEVFRKALQLDADDPQAHLGIAYSLLRRRNFAGAVEWSLGAIGRAFQLPLAHFTLGLALARLDENDRAIAAFETCLRFAPGYGPAHRFLALLYSRRSGAHTLVRQHRAATGKLETQRAQEQARHAQLRSEIVERARLRTEARKQRRAAEATEPVSMKLAANHLPPSSFLIVSGLPRSGTSMMMQMLAAGGLPIMRDDLRLQDASNPRGYYEWQEIKKLPADPFLIEKTHGRVTKVISMLLPSLPRRHTFRVIFMRRALGEVAESQDRMLRRLSGKPSSERAQVIARLEEHRDRMLELLRESENVELLEVSYEELLAAPGPLVAQIAEFSGLAMDRCAAMAAVVEPALDHSALRSAGASGPPC